MLDIITEEEQEAFSPVIQRLTKDAKAAAAKLSRREARYLVDNYYMMQDYRIRTGGQIRAMTETGEPNTAIQWLFDQNTVLEKRVASILDAYSDGQAIGRWARSICGIGPVISAGLIAHIDITRAPVAGAIWRYAGLDPSMTWRKSEESKRIVVEVCGKSGPIPGERVVALCRALGRSNESAVSNFIGQACRNHAEAAELLCASEPFERSEVVEWATIRPWNAQLKTLCWKIGESFVKVSGREDDYYGKVYLQYKARIQGLNESGAYKEAAAAGAARVGKNTEAIKHYSEGVLPPGHIHARAKRYAVKLFLSHFWEVWRTMEGLPVVKPWAIAHGEKHDYIPPPNFG